MHNYTIAQQFNDLNDINYNNKIAAIRDIIPYLMIVRYVPLSPVATVVEANEMGSSSKKFGILEDFFFSGSLHCCVDTDELHAFLTAIFRVVQPVLK